jgi:hypothetical protein
MTVEYCMARGFESKQVASQQEDAARPKVLRRTLTPDERNRTEARETIELSLVHARRELAAASAPAHQRMLEQAIVELEARLASDDVA